MSLLSPKKYTSLPTSVQAIQVGSHNIEQVANWCGGRRPMGQFHIELDTRTGLTRIHLGDYVVQESDGSFVTVSESVFIKRYVLDTGVFKPIDIHLKNFEEARYLAIVRIADWLNQQPAINPLMGVREASAALYEISRDVQKAESVYDEEQAVLATHEAAERELALEQARSDSEATVRVDTYIVNHYHYTPEHEDIAIESSTADVFVDEINVEEPTTTPDNEEGK